MKESEVEKKLVRGVRLAGGSAYKFVSPGNAGVPDRIVLMPNGRIWFVELKADGGSLRPLQRAQISRLTKLGFDVRVLKGTDEVEEFLKEVGR